MKNSLGIFLANWLFSAANGEAKHFSDKLRAMKTYGKKAGISSPSYFHSNGSMGGKRNAFCSSGAEAGALSPLYC